MGIIRTEYILKRENFRVFLKEEENLTTEILQYKLNDEWIPILSNVSGYSTLNLTLRDEISCKKYSFLKQKKKKIYFQNIDEDFNIKIDYCLEDENILHTRYQINTNSDLSFSSFGVKYQILLENNPDFSWVPHICPKDSLVIGDHVFRSPIVIYRKDDVAFAFFPDLKTLTQNRPFKTFLDVNFDSSEGQIPYVFYGFGNYTPYKHVLFKHRKNESFHVKENEDLTFRYYIVLFQDKNDAQIIKFLNKFLWEKYGRRMFYETLKPQVLPYKYNVKEGLQALLSRHALWCDLKLDDIDLGGFWVGSWLGNDKFPLKFFNQSNINEYKYKFNKKNKSAAIYNSAWFLNIRTSYGLRYFGEIWADKELVRKSKTMKNLVNHLPRTRGLFSSIILPESNNTSEFITIKGTNAWWPLDYFNLADITLSMYWLIKITIDFKDDPKDIIENCEALVNLINEIQLKNGEIPTFIDIDSNRRPIIIDDLINSASSGSSLMFLTEYYKISQDKRIIIICEKIADYLSQEILPHNKWIDFEALYSCTYPQKYIYNRRTNSFIANNLSIYWCAEGFLGLYKITNNTRFLDQGERILGILSLFQQVWDIPYISFYTFGGFGVQNADAELNDARQGLFVKTFMEYYLETGKWEYMERGIAALRASWALQLLPDYRELCPGNFEGITTDQGVDKGCISENYGHIGKDQRIPGYISFDWGVGTASMATAYAKKNFGDLYIDFKQKFVFGIDGILIQKFNFEKNMVLINFQSLKEKDSIIIKARNPLLDKIYLTLNEKVLLIENKEDFIEGFKVKVK